MNNKDTFTTWEVPRALKAPCQEHGTKTRQILIQLQASWGQNLNLTNSPFLCYQSRTATNIASLITYYTD